MSVIRGFFLLFTVLAVWGCAHPNPLDPISNDTVPVFRQSDDNLHSLLGMYTFICNPENQSVDFTPLRDADLHLNALKFLEPPALVCLTIEGAPHLNGSILDINIGLRNPYLGLDQFTGFDICGIVFTHGSATGLSDPDIIMPGDGDTRLLNPDGYTRWWNPAEFPHGDTALNYIDGILGTPAANADFNCTINGYKYFADGLDKNDPVTSLDIANRGMFGAGKQNIRHYTLDLSGGRVFNYAIDACWKNPSGTPPYDVPSDFPPAANRPEPYFINVTELENNLYYDPVTGCTGGVADLQIDVYDHFNAASNQVLVESFDGNVSEWLPPPVTGGEGYSTYEIEIADEDLLTHMDTNLLISVVSDSSDYGGILPGKPISAYMIHTVSVPLPAGWVRSWGGDSYSSAKSKDVVVDSEGNIIVTGYFKNTVDFDPGDGVIEHTSDGQYDLFISKFNSNGSLIWAVAIGGPGNITGWSIATDGENNLLISGWMSETVDFDPGPGVYELSCASSAMPFLLKLTAEGSFGWARLWQGWSDPFVRPVCVAVDNVGCVYLTTRFRSTADLDPGPGIDEHTSMGKYDAFLCKLTPSGDYIWAQSWGSPDADFPQAIDVDPTGAIYVTGGFRGKVDFDPGPGIDEWESNGGVDIFLSKFTSDGSFSWAVAWGSDDQLLYLFEAGMSVASDQTGCVYVSGSFEETTDFDPGPGITMIESPGSCNSFLSKFDSEGTFKWARAWGGEDYSNLNYGVTVNDEQVLTLGWFSGTQDFDPTEGTDEHSCGPGQRFAYLCSLNSDGVFKYARSWGEIDNSSTSIHSVTSAPDGSIYTTGCCGGSIDFDPGPDECFSGIEDGAYLYKLKSDGYW